MTQTPVAAQIRQVNKATFTHLVTVDPVLVWVKHGHKRVTGDHLAGEIHAGQMGILPAQQRLTIENMPGEHHDYLATAISFPAKLLSNLPAGEQNGNIACIVDEPLLHATRQALDAIKQSDRLPGVIVEHRLTEILLWLAQADVYFPEPGPPRLADKLRRLFINDLSHDWKAAKVAGSLGMSEATLRRRLAEEATSFSGELSDARLTQALSMIQTSDWSIGRIAAEVGYLSPSRFSARFFQRFGVKPSAIRGADDPGVSAGHNEAFN